MIFLPKSPLNFSRNYSTYIKFSEESAKKISKDPFVQKILKKVNDENFSKAYAKQNPKAYENLKVITNASKTHLISALFMTGFDKSFMALKNDHDFPLFELVDRIAKDLQQVNKE